jgi:hypothetical protein
VAQEARAGVIRDPARCPEELGDVRLVADVARRGTSTVGPAPHAQKEGREAVETPLNPHVEEWHGFEIHGCPGKLGHCEAYLCRVVRGGQVVFDFEGLAVHGDALEAPLEGRVPEWDPKKNALSRVQAIIDLRSFRDGDTIQRRLYERAASAMPQREVRRRLLAVFEGIRQNVPKSYRTMGVDIDGLCMELGVTENEYVSAVDYLLEKEYLKRSATFPNEHNYETVHITADGIDAYEEGMLVGPVVEELVAETREYVDGRLEQLSPKAAQKLAQTYADLVSGETELKWSQVAYACRDILQDFTDAICDPQFLGVQVQVPPKSRTRNKIQAALDARIPKVGATERDLLEAIAEYIDRYFDKLNNYIQKHVHPSRQDQVGAEAAKRCVIYTYLLIADLLSLLL